MKKITSTLKNASLFVAFLLISNLSFGQNDLFGGSKSFDRVQTLSYEKLTEQQRLQGEKDTLGFYLTGHPIFCVEKELSSLGKRVS